MKPSRPLSRTTEPLAAIVLLFPPQEILKSWAWVQTRGIACLLWKKKKTRLPQWLAADQVLWPSWSLHFIDLAFVLVDLTPAAHNVQYIKRRQRTNSPRGQSPSEARPAVRAAPGVWTKLWSLSGFTFRQILLSCNILNVEHILLQWQHNEVWVRIGRV